LHPVKVIDGHVNYSLVEDAPPLSAAGGDRR
jgi:hypothetical protein